MYAILTVILTIMSMALKTCFVEATFESHPFIRCEACSAIAQIIGHEMNESAKLRSSFKAGHRLDANNKVKMQDYETSELRAIDIMEKACDSTGDWRLHQEAGVRIVRRKGYRPTEGGREGQVRYYGSRDRDALDNFDKRLKHFCLTLLDEFDEAIVEAIRRQRDLASLSDAICITASGMCEPAVIRKAELDERRRFEKSEARRRKEEEEFSKAGDDIRGVPPTEHTPKTDGDSVIEPNAATEPDVSPEATLPNTNVEATTPDAQASQRTEL